MIGKKILKYRIFQISIFLHEREKEFYKNSFKRLLSSFPPGRRLSFLRSNRKPFARRDLCDPRRYVITVKVSVLMPAFKTDLRCAFG